VKVFIMMSLCCLDLAFNSFVEFDDFYGSYSHKSRVFVFGMQIIIQISIFYSLFLMMGETYLFRVGLVKVLVRQFRMTLISHPIYIATSLGLGFYRLNNMRQDTKIHELWSLGGLPYFIPLSVMHKIMAAMYYLLNIRSSLRLGSSFFYEKDAWVKLYYSTNKENPLKEQQDMLQRMRRGD